MASIKRRPDGKWRARYRDANNKEYAQHPATKPAGQRWLDEQTAALVTGTHLSPKAGSITLGEYVSEWQSRRTWAPSTTERIERELRIHILPTFGPRRIESIQRAHVAIWAKALPLKPSSTPTVYETHCAILNAAVDDRRIPRNEAKGAQLPKAEDAPVVPLTAEEVAAITADSLPRLSAAVTLTAGTGLRQGELFGVAQDRVDFLRRELRVDQQLWTPKKGRPFLKPPKEKRSYRTIALSTLTVEALSAHVAQFGAGEHGLLFHTDGHPIARSLGGKYMRLVTSATGLSGHGWHDLRHYHASVLLSHGVSPAVVAERLGHSIETLSKTYAHVIRSDEERVRAIVDADFAESADLSRTNTA